MSVPKVLVIEDNAADVELMRIVLLKQLGPHHFDVLRDGEAALEFIRGHRANKSPSDPCVIVLDLGLPHHDGITVLEEVRRSPALTHIQVVVISSFAYRDKQEQVRELGGHFRVKPNDLEQFEMLAAFIADVCRGTPTVSADTH